MKKKKQDLTGEVPVGDTFVPTEMGSARSASLDGEGGGYKYETGPTGLEQGFRGPPWSVEPSMHFVCDEVGIDYDQFIHRLEGNKTDEEMAAEFGVSEKTIRHLKDRFYQVEAILGNYGQD